LIWVQQIVMQTMAANPVVAFTAPSRGHSHDVVLNRKQLLHLHPQRAHRQQPLLVERWQRAGLAVPLALTALACKSASSSAAVRKQCGPRVWRGCDHTQVRGRGRLRSSIAQHAVASEHSSDIVVIGSGLGGLTCAGILAASGKTVTVVESHYEPGGAAHTFQTKAKGVDGKFFFDSGPSLYGGLSDDKTSSPLKHVFQILGEEPEWIKYDRWNAFIPEGEANAQIGYDEFVNKLLPQFGGPGAKEQWERLMQNLIPLAEAVVNGPPPGAVREDAGALITLGRYAPKLKGVPGGPQKLSEPFESFLKDLDITDPFINNWMNMFAFLLQGLPCYGAPTSMMAYMMADMYRKETCLDYPKGGNVGIVDALVRGVEKHEGSQLLLKAHVDEILIESNRAVGVRLTDGRVLRAQEAVVSNADWRVTKGLIPEGKVPELDEYFLKSWKDFPQLKSFIHLHLGFKGDGLPPSHCEEFPSQWGVFNHWRDLEEARNAVLVSCPSMLDSSLAPPGHHVLHAYTPATEPWEDWADLEPGSEAYLKKKKDACDFLYSAVEKQIPDIRDRVVLEMVGTPLTHRRFLRKPAGSYGPRVSAPELLPGHRTPLEGLHMCGDSTFPGIGVPAVVMSGHICANNILSPIEHWQILDRIKDWHVDLRL